MLLVKTDKNNLYNISLDTIEYITWEPSYYEIKWRNFKLRIKKVSPASVENVYKKLKEIDENYEIIEQNELVNLMSQV